VSASKRRPLWSELPEPVRAEVERLAHGRVVSAQNCPGGYSPGFASRLRLADGRGIFVKAMDADHWPFEAQFHRAEAGVAAALPAGIAAPAFLGSFENHGWVVLAFENVNGAEPAQPWQLDDMRRVAAAIDELSTIRAPRTLGDYHPRLGGWADKLRDPDRSRPLTAYSPWAAALLPRLATLEQRGIAVAQGSSLVHFDLFSHNILVTPDRVVFVDWPHARRGAPFVDLVITLSSAAGDEVDPESVMREYQRRRQVDPADVTAVLAAHAGFCVAGALAKVPAELKPIAAAKHRLGESALAWLEKRLTGDR
jgi:Ser/Thr protein kinase RdoA (MazF antagonist)